MKFQLVEKYRYLWPVTVRVPDPQNPGKIVEQRFRMLFEAETREEAIAAQDKYAELKTARERANHEHDQLLKVCKGWDDVVDGEGNATAFSETSFRQAIQFAWFRVGVYAAYNESLHGEEARLGN